MSREDFSTMAEIAEEEGVIEEKESDFIEHGQVQKCKSSRYYDACNGIADEKRQRHFIKNLILFFKDTCILK